MLHSPMYLDGVYQQKMSNVEKSKRKSLTLSVKLDILKQLENKSGSKATLAKKYGVNRATIRKIEVQKERLLQESSKRGAKYSKVKYAASGKYRQLEQALFYWFIQMRDKHQTITNNLIIAKAKIYAKKLEIGPNFKFSETWVRNFKKRYGIRRLKICGEKLSSDVDSVEPFKQVFFSIVAGKRLTTDQLYNADESALFYKALHGHTLVHNDEISAPGFKRAKERITFMPCANASGTHKLPMLMIGKSKSPRAFKNVQIPVEYASSRNAWMTRDLFQHWFHKTFVPNVRHFSEQSGIEPKALLVLDNCTAHHFHDQLVSDDGMIEVTFLPPNVTPLLQPMDQQVIQIVKMKYKEKLNMEISSELSDVGQRLKRINLKDVAYWLHEAWLDVSQVAIQRSWANIGWIVDTNLLHEDDVPLAVLFNSQRNNDAVQVEEYPEEESCVIEYSDADIIDLVCSKANKIDTQGNDESDNDDTQDIAEHEDDEEESIEESRLTRTQRVVQHLARVIEWAEDKNLQMADILHLRKIRFEALQMSLNE